MKTRLLLILLTAALGLISSRSEATTWNWTGLGGNTNWNTPGNWLQNGTLATTGVPSSTDVAQIGVNVYVGNQPTVNTTGLQCGSLIIGGNFGTVVYPVVLTVGNPLTVNGAITISGSCTITGTSTITATSMSFTGAYTLTEGVGTMQINGALTSSNGSADIINFTPNTSGVTPIQNITGGININTNNGSGLTYNNVTTSPGQVNITGSISLSGSTNTFAVGANITMGLSSGSLGSGYNTTGTVFSNAGIITMNSGYSISASNGITITNSGTFTANGNITIDKSIFTNTSTGKFTLQNAITFSIGTNATSFSNSGDFEITAGSILNTGIKNGGTFTNTSTGLINVVPGTSTISQFNFNASNNSLTFNNAGQINLTGLSATANGVCTYANQGTIVNTGTIIAKYASMSFTGNLLTSITNTSPGSIQLMLTSPFSITNQCTITNSGSFTANASPVTLGTGTKTCNITNSGTFSLSNGSTFTLPGSSLTIANTGNFSVSGSTCTLAGDGYIINNGSSGASTNATTIFSLTTSPITITGKGTINNYATFSASSTSPIIIGNNASSSGIVNNYSTGTLTLSGSSNLIMPGTSCTVANAGTMSATSSSISFTNTNSTNTFSNGGTGSTFLGDGCGINLGKKTNMTNSSIFTLMDNSSMYFADGSNLVNSGYFNAGIANSPCVITTVTSSGQILGFNFITNSGYFNLGSTSAIEDLNTATNQGENISNSAYFTLESDRYGCATITGLMTPYNLATGTYNVQRYMMGGTPPSGGTTYRSYHLLSSPVNLSGSTSGTGNIGLTYLNTSALVYNPNANAGVTTTYNGAYTAGPGTGFTLNGSTNPSIYIYEESKVTNNLTFTGGKTIGIYSIASGSVTTETGTTTASGITLPIGTGYYMYYIGTDTLTSTGVAVPPAVGTTMTATGTLNQGTITYSSWNAGVTGFPATGKLSYLSVATPGFNMIGNPYASAIDLNQLYSDNSAQGYTTFYELSPVNPGQSFSSWNGHLGVANSGTSPSRYVASGQGFFVLATASGQSLQFKTDQQTYQPGYLSYSSSPPSFLALHRPDSVLKQSSASLSLKNNNTLALVTPSTTISGLHLMMKLDSNNTESCGIFFHDGDSDGKDNDDGLYFSGFSQKVQMSSYTADGLNTSINVLANYEKGKKIQLFAKGVADGIYSITMTDFQNIDTSLYNIYLIDNQQKDSLDMVHYKTYNFNLTAADTAAFHNRFVLVVERKAIPPYALINFTGEKATSAIQLDWKTSNEGNYTSFGLQKLGANGQYALIDSVQSNGSGFYNFNDQNPISGNNIYRLAQNDINGNVTFAGPININYNSVSASGVFTIYPNPSKDIINVAVNSGTTGNAVIQTYVANIYSLGGTLMDTRQLNTNNFTQDITGYKPGVYILELKTTDGDIIGKAKFVKTN